MASTSDWFDETQTDINSSESITTSPAMGFSAHTSFMRPYNIALLFFGVVGTLVSVLVLAAIWISDRSKINTSTLYIANHTTLEHFRRRSVHLDADVLQFVSLF